MEGVAAISAIFALLDFSGKILVRGYGLLAHVSAAPTEIRILLTEVASTNVILDRVHGLANDQVPGNVTIDKLVEIGALEDCRAQLDKAQECLEKYEQIDGQRIANMGKKLKWSFAEKEIQGIIDHLRGLQAEINQAVNLDSAFTVLRVEQNTKKIAQQVDTIGASTKAMFDQRERDRILNKIAPDTVDLDEAYNSASRINKRSTGQWLISSGSFQNFVDSNENSLLWLRGRPGSGKTILCTKVIETILQDNLSPGLAYFYCGRQNSTRETVSQILIHSILHLLRCNPECIIQLSEQMPKHNQKLVQADYLSLFKNMLPRFQNVYLVVDAIDESEDSEAVVQLFAELLKSSGNLHIFLASREEIEIERALAALAPICVSTSGNISNDIYSFVDFEVKQRMAQKRLKLRDVRLANHITQAVFGAADGIFLQAKMQLDHISSLKSDRAIRNALEHLPSGLNEVYDQVLAQIVSKPGYDRTSVWTVLVWVSSCYSLLTPIKIAEAVSMSPQDQVFDHDNVATDPEDWVSLCGSLLRLDRATGVHHPPLVGLVHYSAEEYLFSEHIGSGKFTYFKLDYDQANLHIAKQCLQYLSMKNFSNIEFSADTWFLPESEILSLKKTFNLLEYASRWWSRHLIDSAISAEVYQTQIVPLLSWFLEPDTYGSNYQVWQSIYHQHCRDDENCAYQTPFYNAIVLGLEHVVRTLLPDHFPYINTQFRNGWTPLTAALKADEESMAYLLLSVGANPNVQADDERHNRFSPLHIAAEDGRERAVVKLLSLGASIDARTSRGTTPFYRAARAGSIRILTTLYEHGCDINARTWDNWTALIEAACIGDHEVVDKLIEWDADASVKTSTGLDALFFGSKHSLMKQNLTLHVERQNLRKKLVETKLDLSTAEQK